MIDAAESITTWLDRPGPTPQLRVRGDAQLLASTSLPLSRGSSLQPRRALVSTPMKKMLRRFLLVALALPTVLTAAPPERPFLLGGIQTHELDHQRWAAALHQADMNTVQVTAYAHQGPWSSSKLWYQEEEPAVLHEIRTARQNGLQVVLILRVALDHNEPENRFLWHGLVYPETEQSTAEWFRTYTDFVMKWGRIAEEEGVEVLGIGSEMNSLAATLPVQDIPGLPAYYLDDESQQRLRDLVGRSEHLFSDDARLSMGAGDFPVLDDFLVERNRAERVWARTFTFDDGARSVGERVEAMNHRRRLLDGHWRAVTEKVRDVYSGRLTLAANFDNYHEVGFWDALDIIGVNAYFPLRATLETPLTQDGLANSWRGIFKDIDHFRNKHALTQPVVFTELGYTRWQGVTVAPWSSNGFIPLWDPEGETDRDRAFFWASQPYDPEERALALQALHRVYRDGHADLLGILYWKLSSLSHLARYEPFMLDIGVDSRDPLLTALQRFADDTEPLAPRSPGDDLYLLAVDAIVRNDVDAFARLGEFPEGPPRPATGQPPLLHLAARLGRHELVSRLITAGADVAAGDATGFLPLHWACYQDDPAMVDLLLPPDGTAWRDDRGETPLMKCARLDNVAVANRLLERGEEIGASNQLGQNALHLAVDQASAETVAVLVAHGGDVEATNERGQTPLHVAAQRGAIEIVAALATKSTGGADGGGNFPAHYAAYFGQADVFDRLFDPEAVFHVNSDGRNLLHLAAHGGSLEILRTLLPYFPTVDGTDSGGWTPVFHAVEAAHAPALKLLLERGATLRHRAADGTTAVHRAAKSWESRLLHHCVGRDVDLNDVDRDGNTPLHHAAGWGRLENIRTLLEAGADPTRLNHGKQTAFQVADEAKRRRAAEILRPADNKKSAKPAP